MTFLRNSLSSRSLLSSHSRAKDDVIAKEDVQCAVCIFCSMKITEDVRKYAAEKGIAEEVAIQAGLEEKAREVTLGGPKSYLG